MTTSLFLSLIFVGIVVIYANIGPMRLRALHIPVMSPQLKRSRDLVSDYGSWICNMLLGGLACLALAAAVHSPEALFRFVALEFAVFGAAMCMVEVIRRSRAINRLQRAAD